MSFQPCTVHTCVSLSSWSALLLLQNQRTFELENFLVCRSVIVDGFELVDLSPNHGCTHWPKANKHDNCSRCSMRESRIQHQDSKLNEVKTTNWIDIAVIMLTKCVKCIFLLCATTYIFLMLVQYCGNIRLLNDSNTNGTSVSDCSLPKVNV